MQERKAQLIREGEFYRVALVHAKAQVKHAARPDVLFHSAVDHATWAVRSRVDSLLKPTGASLATLAPIVVTAVRIFRNRRMGIAGIASAVAVAGFGWYMQQRRLKQATF
ncbi:hypothetical protein CR105_16595 [Massilia eurypsychrophila]|uniref:Uncharacterized protein n=2 Tax=Massilia eurypsychrophila TaxID=1485217 RepID=A0A2G8TD17_9BURK|nr:hypothetical protein CR105_16595 [Massilia eurypsychrophila]